MSQWTPCPNGPQSPLLRHIFKVLGSSNLGFKLCKQCVPIHFASTDNRLIRRFNGATPVVSENDVRPLITFSAVWRAVFTFITFIADIFNSFGDISNSIGDIYKYTYLKISTIHLEISTLHLEISTIHLEISPNTSYLEISPIQLQISAIR